MDSSSDDGQVTDLLKRAGRLAVLVGSESWTDLMDLMDKRVADAEFNVMNYSGSDALIVQGLQRRARSMREFFQTIQSDVFGLITLAREYNESRIATGVSNE